MTELAAAVADGSMRWIRALCEDESGQSPPDQGAVEDEGQRTGEGTPVLRCPPELRDAAVDATHSWPSFVVVEQRTMTIETLASGLVDIPVPSDLPRHPRCGGSTSGATLNGLEGP